MSQFSWTIIPLSTIYANKKAVKGDQGVIYMITVYSLIRYVKYLGIKYITSDFAYSQSKTYRKSDKDLQ